MDTLLRDLRLSLRRIRSGPGFASIIVVTLALGIGANTAIFSVVNALLLRPLPYRDPAQLVNITHFYNIPALNFLEAPVSAIGFRDYRDKTHSFAAVAVETGFAANLTGVGDPERIPASRVSGDFFKVYGVPVALGRPFGPDEDVPGKNHVVVLSDGFWRRVFGADRGVIGRTIQLNDENYTVLGVMPPGFRSFFNATGDLWTPLALDPTQFNPNSYTNEYLNLAARLKSGVTVDAAAAEMRAFAEQLKRDYPGNLGPQWSLHVKSLNELATGRIKPALLVLLGAVGFVLLIACANVANLLLARGAARIKEVAIRTALGADRWVLARQLLTESVVLAMLGGVLGLALAWASVRSMASLVPNLPPDTTVGIDGSVMVFTLLLALATGVLFGLAPALQSSRTDLQGTLREGGRTGSADASGHLVRRVLVVGEIALALTLLIGAGLLIKSVARLQAVDPGFDPHNVLTFNMALPRIKYPNDTVRTAFFDQALQRVQEVPGVVAAGATSVMPFGGSWSTGSFQVEGYTPPKNQPGPWGDVRIVSPGFFSALKIPLHKGRLLTSQDRQDGQIVAVIDEIFVHKYFRDVDPLGKRFTFGPANPGDTTPRWITIVGVVAHAAHEGLDAEPRLQLYLPYAQAGAANLVFAVRTSGDPMASTRAVRAAIQSVDRDMPLSNVRTLESLVDASLGQRRLTMILLGAFSTIALVLASIGIYGIMSYAVTQRAREIGIRMALGSQRSGVLGLVLRQGMVLTGLGVGAGLIGSLLLTRVLGKQLYSVSPFDPATFTLVAVLLAAIALLATIPPAMRATRLDPVEAIRKE